MDREQCRFWFITIFIFYGDRDRSEYELASQRAREVMRDEVRALDVMVPRLEGGIPIRLIGHNVPQLTFSLTAVCNLAEYEHNLGSLTIPRSEDRDAELPMNKIYESACRAF
jgi:hypothetical protein